MSQVLTMCCFFDKYGHGVGSYKDFFFSFRFKTTSPSPHHVGRMSASAMRA
jgi:hypothetical protein